LPAHQQPAHRNEDKIHQPEVSSLWLVSLIYLVAVQQSLLWAHS